MRGVKVVTGAAAAVLLMAYMGPTPALADTIEAALVRAYQNNPQLNAQRASVRSTDENVPQALSGYRPKVALTASAGYQYTDSLSTQGPVPNTVIIHGTDPPRSVGLTVTQTLYNGQQTANKTRAAESQVSGAPRTGGWHDWITKYGWGEGRYRSCGCGPSDGVSGPDARPCRYD